MFALRSGAMESPKPFDTDAPLGNRRAIVRRNPDDPQELELVEATWGSDPRFADGTSYRFVRAEGQTFPARRCLVPASEFHMRVGERRYRVTLDGGNFFYLAAIWEPSLADWPLSYRIVTVAANAEVARYQDRHGAIVQRRQVMQWLDGDAVAAELLVSPPPRFFDIAEIDAPALQTTLAF